MSPSRYQPGDCGTTDRDATVDLFTAVVYYGGVQVLLFGLPVLWLAFLSTAAPRLGVAVLVALPVAAIVVAAGRAGLLPDGLRRLSVRRLCTSRGSRTFCRRAAHLQATLALAVFGGAAAGYAAVTAPLVVTTLLAAVGTALARPLARGARHPRRVLPGGGGGRRRDPTACSPPDGVVRPCRVRGRRGRRCGDA
jgi:hypothetical protein